MTSLATLHFLHPDFHSSRTPESVSVCNARVFIWLNFSGASSRDNAQTAAPRTTGSASSTKNACLFCKPGTSRITNCHQHIANKAATPDTLDGRTGKLLAKSSIVQHRQFSQIGLRKIVACCQFGLAGAFGVFVPRAYGKAIVTTINPVSHRLAESVRNGTVMLNPSGTRYSVAHQACTEPGMHWLGKYRGRHDNCRSGRFQVHPVPVSQW